MPRLYGTSNFQNSASPPIGAQPGDTYFDPNSNMPFIFQNGVWVPLSFPGNLPQPAGWWSSTATTPPPNGQMAITGTPNTVNSVVTVFFANSDAWNTVHAYWMQNLQSGDVLVVNGGGIPTSLRIRLTSAFTYGSPGVLSATGVVIQTGLGWQTAQLYRVWADMQLPSAGIIVGGPAVSAPAVGATMTLNTVLGGNASWLAANVITIPTGYGGLYDIRLHHGIVSGAVVWHAAELRNTANAAFSPTMQVSLVPQTANQQQQLIGAWHANLPDGQTIRVNTLSNPPTNAQVMRLSVVRIGDAI